MGILSITTSVAGQIGVAPRTVRIVTTDSLATVTTAGYLNNVGLEGYVIYNTDIIDMWYGAVGGFNSITSPGTFAVFTPSISNGIITLAAWSNPGDVLLPVVSGNFAAFNGTTGQIKDSGAAPSAASQAFVVMSPGSLTSGQVPKFNDANGTLANSGVVAANILQSALTNPDNPSDLIFYDITATAAALATAGKVNIQVSSGSKQYKVRNVLVNYAAAGLSGGGGDRLLAITDGTTVYNNAGITAALLGTPINTVWGGTGNPLAGTVAMNTSTAAGANLYLQYTGGTTDYSTGQIVVSVLVQRVA